MVLCCRSRRKYCRVVLPRRRFVPCFWYMRSYSCFSLKVLLLNSAVSPRFQAAPVASLDMAESVYSRLYKIAPEGYLLVFDWLRGFQLWK